MYNIISPDKEKAENHSLKNTVRDTPGTTLISQERVRLKITHTKLALTARNAQCNFQKKSRTKTDPVKNSIKGTKGRMLFSQERVGLKMSQSKLALTVLRENVFFQERVRITQLKVTVTIERVQYYFPKKE